MSPVGGDFKIDERWLLRRVDLAIDEIHDTLGLDSAAAEELVQLHSGSFDTFTRYVNEEGDKLTFSEAVYLHSAHFARTLFDYTAALRRIFPSTTISSEVGPQGAVLGYGMFLDAEEKIRSELVSTFENYARNYALTMLDLAKQAGRIVEELRRGGFTLEYLLALRDISTMLGNPETQVAGNGLLNLIGWGDEGELLYVLSLTPMVERAKHDISPWINSLRSIFGGLREDFDVENAGKFLLAEVLRVQGLEVAPNDVYDLHNAIIFHDKNPNAIRAAEAWLHARVNSTIVLLSRGEHRLARRILEKALSEYWGDDYQVENWVMVARVRSFEEILLHTAAQLAAGGQLTGVRRSLVEQALDVLEQGDAYTNEEGRYVGTAGVLAVAEDNMSFYEGFKTYLAPLLKPSESRWLDEADEAGWDLNKYWEGYQQREGERQVGRPRRASSSTANRRNQRARVRGAGRRAASRMAHGGAVFTGARAVRHVI